MIAIGMSSLEATNELRKTGLESAVNIACINSPKNVTLSGDSQAIATLYERFEASGLFARRLKTDGKAYHSNHMKQAGTIYENYLKEVLNSQSYVSCPWTVTMSSTTTGDFVERARTRCTEYWKQNLESTVLFSEALSRISRSSAFHFVEIGPHPALKIAIHEVHRLLGIKNSVPYTPTLKRHENAIVSMLNLAGDLFLHLQEVSLTAVNSSVPGFMEGARFIKDLPQYPWDYTSIQYHEPRASLQYKHRKYTRHDLLGLQVPGLNERTLLWRNVIRILDTPWLADHKLGHSSVFPAAGYIATAVEAFSQALDIDRLQNGNILHLRKINLTQALVLSESQEIETFTRLTPLQLSNITASKIWWQWNISSLTENVETDHAVGQIALRQGEILQRVQFSNDQMVSDSMNKWYSRMTEVGLSYGSAFRGLNCVYVDKYQQTYQASGETCFPANTNNRSAFESSYPIHPTTIDASLQTALIATSAGASERLEVKVPVSIENVEIRLVNSFEKSTICSIKATAEPKGMKIADCEVELCGPKGDAALRMSGVRIIPYEEGTTQAAVSPERHPLLRILWKPDIATFITTSNDSGIGALSNYLRVYADDHRPKTNDSRLGQVAGLVDLLGHKNPNLRILAIDETDQTTALSLPVLDSFNSLRRYESWTRAWFSAGHLVGQVESSEAAAGHVESARPIKATSFDLVILAHVSLVSAHGTLG